MTPLFDTKYIKYLVSGFKGEIDIYRQILVHPDCPLITRVCLGIAVAYALSPIDIIPDFIPVVGLIDDALILPLLVFIAIKAVPKELMEEVKRYNNK